MSTSVIPSLAGLAYPVVRSPIWDTIIQQAVSGKETRVALQTYPRWKWEASFNILRSSALYTEFQQLVGFYNLRQGQFDTFLYTDPDDYSVTNQGIGTGDGSTTAFQLVRALGGFTEPVLAPNSVTHVYNNGVDSGGWGVGLWGTASAGQVNYAVAPANGRAITATFTYYWPCRFLQDECAFSLFLNQFYEVKKLAWESVKN